MPPVPDIAFAKPVERPASWLQFAAFASPESPALFDVVAGGAVVAVLAAFAVVVAGVEAAVFFLLPPQPAAKRTRPLSAMTARMKSGFRRITWAPCRGLPDTDPIGLGGAFPHQGNPAFAGAPSEDGGVCTAAAADETRALIDCRP